MPPPASKPKPTAKPDPRPDSVRKTGQWHPGYHDY